MLNRTLVPASTLTDLFKSKLAYIYVIIGASLWGIIGLFVNDLSAAGFTSLQIVTLRVITAACLLVAYLLPLKPKLLKVKLKDIPLFLGTGILSIVFFNWCYFTAIKEVSLSVAVILLYTGPAFVVLMSRIFFGESLSRKKVIALFFTLLGCILVIRLFPLDQITISAYGILIGLGSGFGYALYSIFGKVALKTYSSLTIITYTFVCASAALLPISGIGLDLSLFLSVDVWWSIIGLGFLPTALAYLLYTKGLSMIESGRASITATIEPLVATVLGVVVFGESLSYFQMLGFVLIIGAVVLIQWKRKKPEAAGRPA